MTIEPTPALVIGGGPAGLMAAEMLLQAGQRTILCDAMPSLGRKFLMAGKSGLNLTKDESGDRFRLAYGVAADWLSPALEFGPKAVMDWARTLGQDVFTGTSGRVFPVAMKGSPLLRAWLGRLDSLGLEVRRRFRWVGLDGRTAIFETPQGRRHIRAGTIVLALGGASWAKLGSDGAWTGILRPLGVPLAPFRPANMGFHIKWSPHMQPYFGRPVKPLALAAGGQTVRGEIVIGATGIEGGGLYPLASVLRDGAALTLDLIPDLGMDRAVARLSGRKPGETVTQAFRRALGLDAVRLALAHEFGRPWPADPVERAERLKALPVALGLPQSMDRAISTAGGIRAEGLTSDLMLRAASGVFAAGEMLDWEAPTGGYLLTGCLATGRWAGLGAAAWLERHGTHDDSGNPPKMPD